MKRFYKTASVDLAEGGYAVRLDTRLLKSPAQAAFILPTEALAQCIAEEWESQEDKIVPDSMPMMSMAATAVDRVVPNRAAVIAEAAGFAGSDLLCYRADTPVELARRQAEAWDPVLTWAKARYDVVFEVTAGVMPVEQPPETKSRFLALVGVLDPFSLAAVHVMTIVYRSLLLALSVFEGELPAMAAFELSRIDETYQAELWGEDEEATKRRERLLGEIVSADRFLGLLRS